MHRNSRTRQLLMVLVAIGFLLAPMAASASKQAVVQIEYKNRWIAGTTFTRHQGGTYGSGIATVATPTATPSIMWPQSIIQSTGPAITYTGFYTVFASRTKDNYTLKAGTISKSHPGAAAATTANGGSMVKLPTATTKCFAQPGPPAPTLPGPALPGSCFPRNAGAIRFPGDNTFGGSARLLRDRQVLGTFRIPPLTTLTVASFARFFTSALTGPDVLTPNGGAQYGVVGIGSNYNTNLATTNAAMTFETNAPLSTGAVNVFGGAFYTNFTLTGSHNFNTTNLTGSISMVKPFLRQTFERDAAGAFAGNGATFAAVRVVTLSFAGEVPEPGTLLLLGTGSLGLVGLVRLRRRR